MIIMKKRTGLIAAIIVLVGIALTISLTQVMVNLFVDYLNWFVDNETLGITIFMLLYIAFGIIALPASFHKYLAGVIYGFGPGIIIAWIGSMIGAIAPFFLGKKWMNPYARRALENYPSLQALENEMTRSFYKDNKKVLNKEMKQKLNFKLKYPSYKEGYDEIIDK